MGKRHTLTDFDAMRLSDKETRARIPGVAFMLYMVLIFIVALAVYILFKYV